MPRTGERNPSKPASRPSRRSGGASTPNSMLTLPRDFSEFVASLNAHSVRYLVVGGHAVGFHGHPRFTGDFDVWVERSDDNAARVIAALADFGFGGIVLTAADFVAPGQVVQLGYPPLRVDLLTDLEGVRFADCYPHRRMADADGVAVPFIGIDGLRQNKRAVGRPQDLSDLDHLGDV